MRCCATSRSTFSAGVHICMNSAVCVVSLSLSLCVLKLRQDGCISCVRPAQDFRKFSEHMQNNGRQQQLYICQIDIYIHICIIYIYTLSIHSHRGDSCFPFKAPLKFHYVLFSFNFCCYFIFFCFFLEGYTHFFSSLSPSLFLISACYFFIYTYMYFTDLIYLQIFNYCFLFVEIYFPGTFAF